MVIQQLESTKKGFILRII